MAQTFSVNLDENEIRLLLVAVRQVKHTFEIAEQQSAAAGEPLAQDYSPVQEAYARLHSRLASLLGGAAGPMRVK